MACSNSVLPALSRVWVDTNAELDHYLQEVSYHKSIVLPPLVIPLYYQLQLLLVKHKTHNTYVHMLA